MISLDTNVLVYAIDQEAGPKQQQALELIQRCAGHRAILAFQVLGEFLSAARKKMPMEDAIDFAVDYAELFKIVTPRANAFESATRAIRQHHFPIWDAMLWATLDQVGCRTLLTEDFQDGRTLGNVKFLNPFDAANAAAVASLLKSAIN